jgi:hypothetical protein
MSIQWFLPRSVPYHVEIFIWLINSSMKWNMGFSVTTRGFYACICRIRRLSITKLYKQYPPTWVSVERFRVLLSCKWFIIILVDYVYAMMLLDIWNLKIFCVDNTSYWSIPLTSWMGLSGKMYFFLQFPIF